MTLLRSAFINVINVSIAASFLMLAVILLRPFLKRVPRWLVCILWALVAVRLVVPFSLESRWSLVPAWRVSVPGGDGVQTANNGKQPGGLGIQLSDSWKDGGLGDAGREGRQDSIEVADQLGEGTANRPEENNYADHVGNPSADKTAANKAVAQQAGGQGDTLAAESGMDGGFAATDGSIIVKGESLLGRKFEGLPLTVGSSIWLVGILAMLAYVVINSVRLRHKVRTAVRMESVVSADVWKCDAIGEPFVLGIIKPRIYLPSSLGETDLGCVLCHERAHVRRGDYLWKPLGFLILCVYWFHPLCWISYLLFCRDVEMACDEKATKDFTKEERKRYCQALLNLGQGKKDSLIGTVAFGENGTKSRIKAILDYKKPTFWVILAGVLACVALGIFFMTSPKVEPEESGQPSDTPSASVAGTDETVSEDPTTIDETTSSMQEELISVSEKEYNEIYEFMQEFMVFPVIWDFDQEHMSGAVDYFAQKWAWTDVTDLEYDAAAQAFYVNADEFAEEMGRYFVMSDSALKSIDDKAPQGKFKIYVDGYLPWFWGFSFGIDRVEEKDGTYLVHGYNAEDTGNRIRTDDALIYGGSTDPFLEFNAVIVREEKDGRLRLKELDGLESGPGSKVNVSQISDAEMKELLEFAEIISEGPVLEQYDVNNLAGVFDFAAQKILQTNPKAIREMDDGRCVVPLSELMSYMEQHFYLPRGFEKCLPKEGEGKNAYPCLAEDGVVFLKKENAEGFDLRADLPVTQNERYYRFGVFNLNAETLRSELAADGKDLTTIDSAVEERYPFELAILGVVRGADGKLRLLFFKPYYL